MKKRIISIICVLLLMMGMIAGCKQVKEQPENAALDGVVDSKEESQTSAVNVSDEEADSKEDSPKPQPEPAPQTGNDQTVSEQPVKDTVSEPSSNDSKDTQPAEPALPEEPESENILEFKFFLDHNGEKTNYNLNDFSGLGIKEIENQWGRVVLSAVYTDVKTAEAAIDALLQREEVSRLYFTYTAYRHENGESNATYPSFESEAVDLSVEFEFDDEAHHHLITVGDFSGIGVSSIRLEGYGNINRMIGFLILIDDREETVNQAIAEIKKMPNIKSVQKDGFMSPE